jgi:hypothetical protein
MADPAPAPERPPYPTSDQEFEFTGPGSAPAWVDPSCASWDNGPALALPVDLYGAGPYTTITAHVGDTVRFKATKGSVPAHFVVEPGDPEVGKGAIKKPKMDSNVSLEDLIVLGTLRVDSLDETAKAIISARSPRLKDIIEGTQPQAEEPAA